MRSVVLMAFCLALAAQASAQDVTVSASDSTQSVLSGQKGKRVTLRLRSGQELTGTVRDATAKLVVVGAVSGREMFDAVVPLEAVEAVLIRTKQ